MIALSEIKHEKCPVCGGGVASSRQFSQHTNGRWNEERTFVCGLTLVFSPNLGKFLVKDPCSHDPEVKRQADERERLLRVAEVALRSLITDDAVFIEALCLALKDESRWRLREAARIVQKRKEDEFEKGLALMSWREGEK